MAMSTDARVLNGQAQMDAIKTYNDLAASLATYNAEKHRRDEMRRRRRRRRMKKRRQRSVYRRKRKQRSMR